MTINNCTLGFHIDISSYSSAEEIFLLHTGKTFPTHSSKNSCLCIKIKHSMFYLSNFVPREPSMFSEWVIMTCRTP